MNSEILRIATIAGMVTVSLLITILTAYVFRNAYKKYLRNASSEISLTLRQHYFLLQLATVFIYLIGIGISIYLIPPLRSLSLSMFAGSGIFAIVIGFASQQALANIVGGIFIIIFKPFVVGDRVSLIGKAIHGTIETITLRHTVIRTWENKRVIVPNSIISTEMVENSNFQDERICRFVEIGISYDSDVDKAMAIMTEEALKHPSEIDFRTPEDIENEVPEVLVRVIGFGDSSVNLRANVWAKDLPSGFQMHCDLNKNIKKRFDSEGIEIPFPHRTIVQKDPKV
jgi:small-conductance mechanosensitive channel